ncbi:MAG: hypothetical protein CMH45_02080 [Muricauda sp.]|nr:hypothetical protein [Allomuricauda sp.]|tara:strand:- start:47967 stop:50729 length:2763 start_codon:yes stop_codon:yes gene_type:complete
MILATGLSVSGQVKIGDNPQNIDPNSVLELESSSRVLVISRMGDSQMNSLTPLRGALVYNTDTQCVHYYDGTQWVNLCSEQNTTNVSLTLNEDELVLTDSDGNTVSVTLEGVGVQTFSADPVVNNQATVVITQTGDNFNFEVGTITGENIVDGSINGFLDIQFNSISADQLAPNSVGQEELQDNTVADAEIDYDLVTLQDFNNDAGFITGADIVSGDTPNAIVAGSDGGAFYDDSGLQTQITNNETAITNHIANDGDLDDQNELVVSGVLQTDGTLLLNRAGGNPPVNIDLSSLDNAGTDNQDLANVLSVNNSAGGSKITNLGTPTADADAATKKYVDDEIAGIPAGSDNQTLSVNNNNLSITGGNTVPLPITQVTGGANVNVTGTGTNANPYIINASAGGPPADGSETIINGGTGISVSGVGTSVDPYLIENTIPAADGDETILTEGTNITITGTGTAASPYVINATGSTNTDEQQLTLEPGNLLTLENGGTPIDLSPFLDDQTATDVPFTTYLTLTEPNTQLAIQQLKDELDAAVLTGGGEINTGNNVGIGGIGPFLQKNASILEFKNINVGSAKVTITDDVANNEIDIDIDETQLILNDTQIQLATPTDYDGDTNNENNVQEALNAIASISSDDQNDSEVPLATPTDYDGDTNNENNVQEALNAISTENFAESDLILGADRTHDLGGNDLYLINGSIGIGAIPATPQSQLDVNGQIQTRSGFAANIGTANQPSYGFSTEATMGMYRAGVSQLGFSTNGIQAIIIDSNRDIGIGQNFDNTNVLERLHVDGNIRADGDFISNGTTLSVPDYVFQHYFTGFSEIDPNYTFKSLANIENFLKKNHHLPGIKSAAQVKAEGVWNLSESNLKNLEKIEELFLYTIEQEKKIKALQEQNQELNSELQALKKDMAEIKAMLKAKN